MSPGSTVLEAAVRAGGRHAGGRLPALARTRASRATVALCGALLFGAAASYAAERTPSASQPATNPTLQSPDQRIEVRIGSSTEGMPTYTVTFAGKPVIAASPLGLELDAPSGGRLATALRLRESSRNSADRAYTLVAGKTRTARDHYNELVLRFEETKGRGRRLDVTFRAYDDGVAFRYRLPPQPGLETFAIRYELTRFDFPADYDCWALNLGRFGTSHEGEYDAVRASRLRPHNLIDLPLVCRTGEGRTTLALAEADLRDYAGLYLAGRGDGGLGVESRLSPRLDDPGIAVRARMSPEGVASPWRLIMIADRPGRLIESTLVMNLNPDPPSGDTSWIKPGKSAWDWWSGPLAPGIPKPGMNDATMRHYIDFASKMGLQYMLVDDGWYVGSGHGGEVRPGADILRPVPEIDLPGLVKYAADRKVGLFLWVHWKLIDKRMDEALALYSRLGIKGIKVDFMDRDDQEMVAFYHRLLRKTAEHRLLLDLHGAYRPTGLVRTYPHFLTQEGVMGAEYNKWSRRVTATHNVTLPFTRMLLGPMDYTPGGFRNVAPENFEIRNDGPMVMTTRAHGLAMYVVYESPFACVSDSPDAYAGQDGTDFLKLVPASWDETRVLAGEIGEHILIARRHGTHWYVGAMNNEHARTASIPLDFLGTGSYAATIWTDGESPSALRKSSRTLTSGDAPIVVALAPGGGAVMHLEPRASAPR